MMSRSHMQFNVATFGYRYFLFINKSRQLLSIHYILCRRCLTAANAEIIVTRKAIPDYAYFYVLGACRRTSLGYVGLYWNYLLAVFVLNGFSFVIPSLL